MKQFDFVVAVTDLAVQGFAAATGDWNPIHFDESSARQAGIAGRCAHGLWVAGLAAEQVAGAGYRVKRITARFERAVLVGSTLQMHIQEKGDRFSWAALGETGERMASGEVQIR